ncbi:M91 family zinc metallopeptidase [Plantactinospora alkalitolerans]|uniref:M91 family zinc metallopeptidase n=1 Tax=Plantactinospora alkalitolerans TaxID=2789879 RepID=UPI00389B2E6B
MVGSGRGLPGQLQPEPAIVVGRTAADRGLFHEFAQVYDYGNDTLAPGTHEGPDDVGVNNREREAVGLPVDEDDDPNTPGQIDPDHPYSYTENAFRDELGWPKRTSHR